jgi:UDP:flavonoid glycosyltransferase YjiC (YdhE family)
MLLVKTSLFFFIWILILIFGIVSVVRCSYILLLPHYYPGDITPFLSLGQQLKLAGHRASVALPEHLSFWVEQSGLEFLSWGDGFERYTDISEQIEGWSGKGNKTLTLKEVIFMVDDTIRLIFEKNLLLSRLQEDPPDLIVCFPVYSSNR